MAERLKTRLQEKQALPNYRAPDFQRPPRGRISCAAQYFWLIIKFCKARKGRVADTWSFSQVGKDETSSERCVCVGVCAVEVEKAQT